MVFYNPASLLPRPSVAVAEPPPSNDSFVVSAALAQIGDLVKKKSDVESLRAEANKYADYAETQGNTSIAKLLRDRAQGYSLLTDPNQERGSLLKGITTLTELEETERNHSLISSVAKFDNMRDDKLRALQQTYGNEVNLFNKESGLNQAQLKNEKAAWLKSGPIPVGPEPVLKPNSRAEPLKAAKAALDSAINGTPDSVLKSSPSNAVPGGTPSASLPVPGADDNYTNPGDNLKGNEVSGEGFNDVNPEAPTEEGGEESDTGDGITLIPGQLFKEAAKDAPEGLMENPSIPFGSPRNIALTEKPPLTEKTAPVAQAPSVATPIIPEAQEGAAGDKGAQDSEGLKFLAVPKIKIPESADLENPTVQAKIAAAQDEANAVTAYNYNLKSMYDSIDENIDKFQNKNAAKSAKTALADASKRVSEIQGVVGSTKWLKYADAIMSTAKGRVEALSTYSATKADEIKAQENAEVIQVKQVGDKDNNVYNATIIRVPGKDPIIRMTQAGGKVVNIYAKWLDPDGWEPVDPGKRDIFKDKNSKAANDVFNFQSGNSKLKGTIGSAATPAVPVNPKVNVTGEDKIPPSSSKLGWFGKIQNGNF